MDSNCKLNEEKLRVAQKDIDGLRLDMNSLETDMRKISDSLISINHTQERILKELNTVMDNGGTARCHERQIVLDGILKSQADNNLKTNLMEAEIVELKRSSALSAQSSLSNVSIQKWGLEIVKSIVVAVVIALIVTSLGNTSDNKEVTTDNANKTIQIQ